MAFFKGLTAFSVALFFMFVTFVLWHEKEYTNFPIIETIKYSTIDRFHDRIVFVGDIHGMYDQYRELIEDKVKPDANTTVVLLGDFISKGPDSNRIVNEVILNDNIDYRVECVLGNNELRTIYALLNPLTLGKHNIKSIQFTTDSFLPDKDTVNKRHKQLAKELGWSSLTKVAFKCSAMWQFHDNEKDKLTLVGVHAGVLPEHLPNPMIEELTEMKYADINDHTRTSKKKIDHGIKWYKLWNHLNKEKYQIGGNVNVLYGHNSKKGLNIRRYTKGLDSGCVNGKSLTALEYVWNRKTKVYDNILHSVSCDRS